MRRKVTAVVTPADWEHSKLAIQETGGWIKNADTKSTVLAGSFGLSLTFAIPRLLEALSSVMAIPFAFGLWIVCAAIFLLAALTTGFGIGNALLPRTSVGGSLMNRFAWPSLAGVSAQHLPPSRMTADEVRTEAWEQAASLARIAAVKYRYFKVALIAFAVYLGALLALVITQTFAAMLG